MSSKDQVLSSALHGEALLIGLGLWCIKRLHRNGAERATKPFDLGGVLHTMGNAIESVHLHTNLPVYHLDVDRQDGPLLPVNADHLIQLGRPRGFASSVAAVCDVSGHRWRVSWDIVAFWGLVLASRL